METYCGKSCDNCRYVAELNCPGCKNGPGKVAFGDCKIGKCCREKGHAECEGCDFKRNCGLWIGRMSAPQQRIEDQKEAQEKKAEYERLSTVYGKWLWALFWLYIGVQVVSLLGNVDALSTVSSIGLLVGDVIMLFIFIKLGSVNEYYKETLPWGVVSAVLKVAQLFILSKSLLVTSILSIALIVINLIFIYKKFVAYEETAEPVDYVLAQKWKNLWTWYIATIIGAPLSMLLALMMPGAITLLLVLAFSIVAIVVAVFEIVYVYRTAMLYRE